MELLYTIIVGIIAGWIAGIVMKGGGYGVIGDLVLGILGALVGRWIFGLIGVGAYGTIGTVIVSVIGAIILIAASRAIRRA